MLTLTSSFLQQTFKSRGTHEDYPLNASPSSRFHAHGLDWVKMDPGGLSSRAHLSTVRLPLLALPFVAQPQFLSLPHSAHTSVVTVSFGYYLRSIGYHAFGETSSSESVQNPKSLCWLRQRVSCFCHPFLPYSRWGPLQSYQYP